MTKFDVHILGCGSATPSLRHLPACQVVNYRDRLLMIDCGEGAQLSLRRSRLKFSRITDIFISHMHGDHFLGLPGLLSTLALHQTGGTVTVHIQEQGANLLRNIMNVLCRDTSFELKYNIFDPVKGGVLLDTKSLKVTAFPLFHRVPCCGFRFDEKPKARHIKGDMIAFYNVPVYRIAEIKGGADYVTIDGRVIPNSALTTDADPSVSYAYCSDTVYDERVIEAVRGVDVLYHESTYGDDQAHKAAPRGHSTARQAAEVALRAGVKRLVLGHFSKSYEDETPLVAQAREIFPDTVAAHEGMIIHVL
ncbi:MAG: ribonuclease Z [Muribaculaceae bacterium]|nr:ribonuclease Z [Muribaculaceae bacterium]